MVGRGSLAETLLPIPAGGKGLHLGSAEPSYAQTAFVRVELDPLSKEVRFGVPTPIGARCAVFPVTGDFAHDLFAFGFF